MQKQWTRHGKTHPSRWVVKTQRDRGYSLSKFTWGLLKHPNLSLHWQIEYMDNDPKAQTRIRPNVDFQQGIVNSSYEPSRGSHLSNGDQKCGRPVFAPPTFDEAFARK